MKRQVGAGSVLSLRQAETAIGRGAKFIMSPGLSVDEVQKLILGDGPGRVQW